MVIVMIMIIIDNNIIIDNYYDDFTWPASVIDRYLYNQFLIFVNYFHTVEQYFFY